MTVDKLLKGLLERRQIDHGMHLGDKRDVKGKTVRRDLLFKPDPPLTIRERMVAMIRGEQRQKRFFVALQGCDKRRRHGFFGRFVAQALPLGPQMDALTGQISYPLL